MEKKKRMYNHHLSFTTYDRVYGTGHNQITIQNNSRILSEDEYKKAKLEAYEGHRKAYDLDSETSISVILNAYIVTKQ